jgi:hypothetical protein
MKQKIQKSFLNNYLNRNSKKAIMNYLFYQKYTTYNNMFLNIVNTVEVV